jgi:hypothetical protein
MLIDALRISTILYMFYYLGNDDMIFAWYQRLIERLPWYLYKPLGGCHVCLVGQGCFWYFIFFHKYNLIEHLFFVSIGIIFAMILDKLINYLNG